MSDLHQADLSLDREGIQELLFTPGQEPPVNGFWSLALYNEHHFFHSNKLERYSLGTRNKNLKRNADGSLTLYAGAKSPQKDKENNWLPAPKGHFSLYIRAYCGQQDKGQLTPIVAGPATPEGRCGAERYSNLANDVVVCKTPGS